jgi:hypothetical protein
MARTTIATLTARLAVLEAALAAKSAPAQPVASAHVGPSGKRDGREFPCTATPACTRSLRSAARAAVHGVELGHVAR